jgi:hypothetical protein
MPEVASIFSGVQIGAETTSGTAVSATKLLNYLSLNLGPSIEFNKFRPMGQLVSSAVTPGKDSSEIPYTGVGSYSEMVVPLCGLITNTTPATIETTARRWTFTPLGRSEDTIKTFTVEAGSATRAQRATYGLFTGLEVTFNRTDGVQLSGSMVGQNMTDNATLTGSPTAYEDVPILPTHLNVYIDTTSGSFGSTKMTRDFNAVFRCNDKFGTVWPINSANASYVSHVNTEPAIQMELTFEADSQGMAFLTNARAGSALYVRMEAVSTVLAGSTQFYDLKIDMAGKISEVGSFDDTDGVKTWTITLDAFYDTNWSSGRYLNIVSTNKTATL